MTLIEILIGFALVVFCAGYLFLHEAGVIMALQDAKDEGLEWKNDDWDEPVCS